jgi:hypothetical protein
MVIFQSVEELVNHHTKVEALVTIHEIIARVKQSEAHIRRTLLNPNGIKPMAAFGTVKLYSKIQIDSILK